MGRQVRGYVNREAGFKGAEASQQDAVAEAGDRDQGSAPQGQKGTPKHATVKALLGQIKSAVLPDAGPPRFGPPLASAPRAGPVKTAARR